MISLGTYSFFSKSYVPNAFLNCIRHKKVYFCLQCMGFKDFFIFYHVCQKSWSHKMLIIRRFSKTFSKMVTVNPTYLGLFWEWKPWGVKMTPPLKIFNNEVKMLKLVPNLGNHTNFSKLHRKKFYDKNFWWRQHFLAKSDQFRSIIRKFVIF